MSFNFQSTSLSWFRLYKVLQCVPHWLIHTAALYYTIYAHSSSLNILGGNAGFSVLLEDTGSSHRCPAALLYPSKSFSFFILVLDFLKMISRSTPGQELWRRGRGFTQLRGKCDGRLREQHRTGTDWNTCATFPVYLSGSTLQGDNQDRCCHVWEYSRDKTKTERKHYVVIFLTGLRPWVTRIC